MLWALVITGIMFGTDGQLKSTQGVLAFTSAADCEKGAAIAREEITKKDPGAKLVIGCVPMEKPVKS